MTGMLVRNPLLEGGLMEQCLLASVIKVSVRAGDEIG
jgi:hypothetical protein